MTSPNVQSGSGTFSANPVYAQAKNLNAFWSGTNKSPRTRNSGGSRKRLFEAVPAGGSFLLNASITAGQTFTINGTVITFVASGATGNQINVGTLATGAMWTNIRNFLNSSVDPGIAALEYSFWQSNSTLGDGNGTIYMEYKTPGTAGNSVAISSTAPGLVASGNTLTGGQDAFRVERYLSTHVSSGKTYRIGRGASVNSVYPKSNAPATISGAIGFDESVATAPYIGPNVSPTATVLPFCTCSFLVYGNQFTLGIRGSAAQPNDMQICIDGVDVTDVIPVTNTSITLAYNFTMPNAGPWEVTIRQSFIGGTFPSYVTVPSSGMIAPVPQYGPKIGILADSYGHENGYSRGTSTYIGAFAHATGFERLWVNAKGGSGYTTAGGSDYTFGERVQFFPVDLDAVIMQLSVNDLSTPVAVFETAFVEAVGKVKDRCPFAKIVFFKPATYAVSSMGSIERGQLKVVREYAAKYGHTMIDLTELPMGNSFVSLTTTLSAPTSVGATSITTPVPLCENVTYKFSDGTKFLALSTSTGTGPYTTAVDGTLQTAHPIGDTVTMVGNSIITGTGRVGATTGNGTRDVLIGNDGVHPSVEGSILMGYLLAQYFRSVDLGNL